MRKTIKYLLIIFLLFGSNFCFAAWSETTSYWCTSGCGGNIVKQVCYTSCSCGENASCSTDCSGISIVATAQPWQKCVGGNQVHTRGRTCGPDASSYNYWSSKNKFYFVCDSSCLPNVSDVRYYNNPNYPTSPNLTINGSDDYPPYCSDTIKTDCIEPSDNSSSNVKLPFKIDWDEDPYWLKPGSSAPQYASGTLSTNQTYENKHSGGPQSYILTLNVDDNLVSAPKEARKPFSDYISKDFLKDKQELSQGYFQKLLNLNTQPKYIDQGTYRSSEYNFRVDHNPCWLKSGKTYDLTIQTCCNEDGTECNQGGNFSFTTSYSPELKSPEDLDWSGPNYSAHDAWKDLTLEDFVLDNEGRVLNVPIEKYKPFDWEKNSLKNYKSLKVEFPIFLDWCDVSEVNEVEKKGKWLMRLFQFTPNAKGELEDVLHKGIVKGEVPITAKAIYAGVDWTKILLSNFLDESRVSYFTKNEKYSWEIESCLTEHGSCQGAGTHFSFETGDIDIESEFYFLNLDNAILGVPTEIRWATNRRVNSVKYEIPGIISGKTEEGRVIIDNLKLDTTYTIKAIPCTDYASEKCEPEKAKTLTFKTTGRAPKIDDIDKEVFIPFEIGWEAIPEANSYYYHLNGIETLIDKTSKTLFFPEVESDTEYSLKVKTCADKEGQNCGDYSSETTFKTKKLETVKSLSTEKDNGILYTKNRQVSFDEVEGASYYKYELKYIGDQNMKEEDISKTCKDLKDLGSVEQIISRNSFHIDSLCPDKYEVSLTACLDSHCKDHGDKKTFSFKLETLQAPKGQKDKTGGLVPCNREYDDPNTAWDETLACNTSHVFLLVRLLFDFCLGRLLPAIFIVLLLYNGALYIFHLLINFENPAMDLMQKSKEIWKAVGIGFLIILLSWTVINAFLMLVDPSMSFFHNWWDPF